MAFLIYKNCLTFIFLTVVVSNVKAQAITLNDLFRIHNFNEEQIDDYAVGKSYSFIPLHKVRSNVEMHSYEKYDKAGFYHMLSVQYYDKKYITYANYVTHVQSEYISLKSQIKNMGYTFTSSDSRDDMTIYYYHKNASPKYHIEVIQSYVEASNKTSYTIYVINTSMFKQAQRNSETY